MSEAFHTELVNFQGLSADSSADRRAELARHVAVLFSLTSDKCSDEQVDIYDSVLLRLVDMVEVEVRRFVAERLSELRRGPERTIRQLAGDQIDVAESLLRKSTVLRDCDLVDIAGSNGNGHRLAIAEREVLSEEVTDVLVRRGDIRVKRRVAANQGAVFSTDGMAGLLDAATDDPALQTALSERNDLAETEIERLVTIATGAVRERLLSSGENKEAERLPQAARIAVQRMSNEYWLSRYDFETARGRVMALVREGRLNETSLRWFAADDRFAEAVVAFACLTKVGLHEASHWMVRLDVEPFLIVAKAHGFSSLTVSTLLKVGPWRHRLSVQARAQAVAMYEGMRQDEAIQKLSHWDDMISH
ncbi:DUF2336 domain-containing protein [Polymorphum gilvum]|uniref:DUF2336 domain-containing protein n=1 Tax=Polymorphum gilvum (strain LMG 25793 / CGMCC 1.9160 / SL003B-26A1) TaxID=991905 RepID=F2J1F0_POLGS|nr:DUF2336 domain-containing protein [Polymorphum gilvum]ADZ69732.1 hypothetical protein SL003B_1304 [Polymorphum gilvum SL003B-26A1]